MTNQQGAPEALRLAAEVLDWMPTSDTQRALWDRHQEALAVVNAALVEAQQPATHVQNPAEIEHVAGDVSKNGPESNMAQQPAPSAAAAPVAVKAMGYGGSTGINDYLMSDGTVQAMRPSEVKWAPQPSPAPQADSAPHPIDPAIAADLERSDWTPEEALRWYAAGKHYDTVPNGDGSSSARILDNGAVASNALKSLSREYAEHKGDVALLAPQADSTQDEFISREEWVERAMRVYLIAGDTEDEARECAEYQWGELDMDDIPDPYFAAMEDIEGRGPAPQADSQPAPDERDDFEKVFPLPSGCIRCGAGYASTGYSNWAAHTHVERWKGWQARAASAPADSVTAPAGGAVAGWSVKVGPAGLEWLIAEINKLPTVSASEIDGEESDGTPRHWRNRPHVSLRKLERLLREFFTPPPADAAPTPPAQAADSVLEDAARLLRQILAASKDGDSDTHLSAHFVSRIETIAKAGGAA